jgi:hypothetical protein
MYGLCTEIYQFSLRGFTNGFSQRWIIVLMVVCLNGIYHRAETRWKIIICREHGFNITWRLSLYTVIFLIGTMQTY